jgi:hypothetical protein
MKLLISFFRGLPVTVGIVAVGVSIGTLVQRHLFKPSPFNRDAIVRLHDMETGNFFCSGTMISDKLIVTAAHCLIREEASPLPFLPPMTVVVKQVEVVLQSGLRLTAETTGISPMLDQALLRGDFVGLAHAHLETDTATVVNTLTKKNVISCGFPMGGALYCLPLKQGKQYEFFFAFEGFLYPGMSGGPVYDVETGSVVATNFLVTDDIIAVAGTQEEFVSTNAKDE